MKSLLREIAVPTVLLTVVVLAALAYIGWDAAVIARSLRRNAAAVRTATALTLEITEAVHDEERWVAVLASRPEQEARLAETELRVAQLVRRVDALALSPASRAGAAWSRFVAAREELRPLREDVLAASRSHDSAGVARAMAKWQLMSDRADALLNNVTAYHLKLLDRTVAELQHRHRRALEMAAATVCFGLLVAGGFSLRLARTVVRPMREMASAAGRVTVTRPPAPLPGADRRDELGILARAFNAMTRRLVAANAELAEAVQARDDFISLASHELRTPITPLQLRVQQFLRLLAARPGDPADRQELAGAARNLDRHVSRLGKLVDNMLDVSRITSGRLMLNVEEVALLEVVRDALDRTSDDLAAAGCTTVVECAGDVRVRADRSRIEQVVVNLAGNAAKYAPGTPVVIRVRAAHGDAVVEVEDAGPGVAPEDQQRIFTRFERAGRDRHEVSGLGLGLFIAREIARAHGGEISVRSAAGKGALFALRLPMDSEEPSSAREEAGAG